MWKNCFKFPRLMKLIFTNEINFLSLSGMFTLRIVTIMQLWRSKELPITIVNTYCKGWKMFTWAWNRSSLILSRNKLENCSSILMLIWWLWNYQGLKVNSSRYKICALSRLKLFIPYKNECCKNYITSLINDIIIEEYFTFFHLMNLIQIESSLNM